MWDIIHWNKRQELRFDHWRPLSTASMCKVTVVWPLSKGLLVEIVSLPHALFSRGGQIKKTNASPMSPFRPISLDFWLLTTAFGPPKSSSKPNEFRSSSILTTRSTVHKKWSRLWNQYEPPLLPWRPIWINIHMPVLEISFSVGKWIKPYSLMTPSLQCLWSEAYTFVKTQSWSWRWQSLLHSVKLNKRNSKMILNHTTHKSTSGTKFHVSLHSCCEDMPLTDSHRFSIPKV
jgi:hypothetical protein